MSARIPRRAELASVLTDAIARLDTGRMPRGLRATYSRPSDPTPCADAAAAAVVWVPVTDSAWRAYEEPADYCKCRWTMPNRKACGRPGVADIQRGTTQRWPYCENHLYGKRWVAGRLWKSR